MCFEMFIGLLGNFFVWMMRKFLELRGVHCLWQLRCFIEEDEEKRDQRIKLSTCYAVMLLESSNEGRLAYLGRSYVVFEKEDPHRSIIAMLHSGVSAFLGGNTTCGRRMKAKSRRGKSKVI